MFHVQPQKADIGGHGELLLTWLIGLGLLLGLIWVLVRAAGNWLAMARARAAAGARGPIRVLAQTSLGGSHGLHVVAVGGKTLLLATGEQGVSLIADVDGAAVEDALDDLRQRGRRSFHELLQAALRRRAPGPSAASPESGTEPDVAQAGSASGDGRGDR